MSEKLLSRGLASMGLDLPTAPLLAYLALLEKWNHAYNLTAVQGMENMISRHLLDSLAIMRWVSGSRVIDVGTGAGLPGIPLALALPDTTFVLLDSNGKKTRFLHEVKRQLDLKNVTIEQTRVENYHPSLGFDTVVSRAFSELGQMIAWTAHLLVDKGIWLAMKGHPGPQELASVNYPYRIETYNVPGGEGDRSCVIVNNKKE